MLESISSTKIRNKTEEAPFGISCVRTKAENYLRVKPIIESKIGFFLEMDWYSCD